MEFESCVDEKCKSIRFLSLRGFRNVTTKGIKMALKNLSQLKWILRQISLLEFLAEITQNAIDQKLSLPKYSLTTLYMLDDTVFKIISLRKSVLMCPNVTNMELNMFENQILEETDLLSLLSLGKVYALEIINTE
jgi:hypothetical protein